MEKLRLMLLFVVLGAAFGQTGTCITCVAFSLSLNGRLYYEPERKILGIVFGRADLPKFGRSSVEDSRGGNNIVMIITTSLKYKYEVSASRHKWFASFIREFRTSSSNAQF
jgi:hypothetical protein